MTEAEGGRLVGQTHHFPVRVYFADTDAAGMVYYANYFRFAERARTEMMRQAGFDHNELYKRLGLLLGVYACDARYVRPAWLDDVIEVRTQVIEVGGASMRLRQDMWREEEEIARLGVRLVCIGSNGKATLLPDDVRDKVQGFIAAEAN
jgi:acyl-CoA thioester hydrolase